MKQRFLVLSFIVTFVVSIFGLGIFFNGDVLAASTYRYINMNVDTDNRCLSSDNNSDGLVMSVIETVDADPNAGLGQYEIVRCYLEGSGYLFTLAPGQPSTGAGGNGNITVDGADPSVGVLGILGAAQGSGIQITNVNTFNTAFPNAVADTDQNVADANAAILAREQECTDNGGTWEPVAQTCDLPVGDIANDDSCEGAGSESSFIICPLIRQANEAFSRLDDEIIDSLDVDEAYYADPSVEEAWARIRNIAYILLIPVMLVMVIGTALGFSFIDAYTVKRAMPRLFIAIIFMALSYDILIIFIEIINAVGLGIAGIIAAPFGGLDQLTLQAIFTPSEGTTGIGIGVLALVGSWVALGSALIGILATYLAGMALVLLIIFVMLAVRELLLVFLLIMAPLAIISWIFPGNDKLWKLWWGSFSKLLYLFPIIMALLATGRAFASLIQNNDGADGFVVSILKITAFVGPYFFIPKAFALAGGAFSNIAGIANDRSKGMFDRNRKKRSQYAQKGLQTTKDGNRTGVGSKFANRVGMGAASGAKGRYGFGKRGQHAMARVADEATARNAKENGALQQLALHNDDGSAVMALSGGTQSGAEEASQQLKQQWIADEAAKAAKAAAAGTAHTATTDQQFEEKRQSALKAAQSVGINKRNAQAGMQLMMQNKARAINAGDTNNLVEKGLDRLHGTNGAAREESSGEAQYFARQATRNDLGGKDGINKSGLYGIANGETKTITAMGDRQMVGARAGRMDQSAAVHYRELESMKTNATGLNRDEIVSQMTELETLGIKSYMSGSSGSIDPITGVQKQVESVERFDGARALADPDYARAHASWTPAEKTAGQRRVTRDQNMSELAAVSARKYEQVDPNHL